MATLYEFNNNKILIEENPLGIAKFVREEVNQEFGNISNKKGKYYEKNLENQKKIQTFIYQGIFPIYQI